MLRPIAGSGGVGFRFQNSTTLWISIKASEAFLPDLEGNEVGDYIIVLATHGS